MATRATFATLAPDWASTTIRFFFSGFVSRRRQGMRARTASAGAATSSTTRWLPSVSASHVPVVYGMAGTTPGGEAGLRAVVWAASTASSTVHESAKKDRIRRSTVRVIVVRSQSIRVSRTEETYSVRGINQKIACRLCYDLTFLYHSWSRHGLSVSVARDRSQRHPGWAGHAVEAHPSGTTR